MMQRISHLNRNPGTTDLHACEAIDVAHMSTKFWGHLRPTRPVLADQAFWDFRHKLLQEEVQELDDAHRAGDLREVADALVDTVIVAMGTAWWLGLPWEDLWANVHQANLAKQGGATKRGHPLDLVKPPGWQRPEHGPALLRHGWHPNDVTRFDPTQLVTAIHAHKLDEYHRGKP